jgi:hypothetical protein
MIKQQGDKNAHIRDRDHRDRHRRHHRAGQLAALGAPGRAQAEVTPDEFPDGEGPAT